VPTSLVFGDPVPDIELAAGIDLPDYLRPYRR
jgi:hypothetical protein